MKKILLTTCVLISLMSLAQTYQPPIQALRTVFGGLNLNPTGTYNGSTTPEFLYDMSAHVVDDKFFVPISNNQSNSDNFFFMYEEMYNSAKVQANWETPDNLANRALQFSSDTVPILSFNFDFLKIREVALTTGDYFQFDLVNDILLDHSNPVGDPFELHEVFAAAPVQNTHKFTNVTYLVDPSFIIFDSRNSLKKGNPEFTYRIDFGDGNGFVVFDNSITTYHDVIYPSDGTFTGVVEILVNGNNLVNKSTFEIHVLSPNQAIPPDNIVSLDGLRAGFYDGCADGPQPPGDKKFIIYLEGIDLTDFLPRYNRTIPEIYDDMIVDEDLAELINFGYSFVIVDWKNSRKDMRDNSMSVVELIDYIKCTYPNNHELVIVGESMGGVVGRHALTYMETDDYMLGNLPSGGEPCFPELMHKTRLFISLDAPHQGANVPLSLQEFYKHITTGLTGGIISHVMAAPVRLLLQDIFNVGLGSDAAKQLLLYHADTRTGSYSASTYTSHSKHTQFFDELESIGDYPRFTKLMALSNGSLSGGRQTRAYDLQDRLPSDILFEFNGEVHARVLHILKIPVFGANLDLRTNPQGAGRVYEGSMGTWGIDIDLYWFGIDVNVGLISMANKEIDGQNLNSFCVHAGGLIDPGLEPDPNGFDNSNEGWPGTDFPMFKFSSTNDSNGVYTFSTEVGIPWVAQAGAAFQIRSDGSHFNFIPVKSGLDWNDVWNQPFSPDIENTPWPARIENSAFDVITGIHTLDDPNEEFAFDRTNNRHHLTVKNPALPGALVTCNNLNSWVLNREIGDEILYLNNRDLPYNSLFEAEREIFVNPGNNNPHYDYESSGPPPVQLRPVDARGFYSKEELFTITAANPVTGNPPVATMKFEDNLFLPAPDDTEWGQERIEEEPGILSVCCFTSENYRKSTVHTDAGRTATESEENNWAAYPNPTKEYLYIVNNKIDKGIYRYSILSAAGQELIMGDFKLTDGRSNGIGVEKLTPGIYVVAIYDGVHEMVKFKLMKR